MEAGRTLRARATGISTAVIVLIISISLVGFAHAVLSTASQPDWNQGAFNGTSADRDDNSGELGLGYRNGTAVDSLKGYWRFDRAVSGSGGSVNDYSGNINDGTTNNGITTGVGGVFSTSSFSFDGTDDHVTVPEDTSLDITSGVTMSAWVYPAGTMDSYTRIVQKGQNDAYEIWIDSGTTVPVLRINGQIDLNRGGLDLPQNQWTHIVGTYNTSTDEARMYFNGTLVASTVKDVGSIGTNDNEFRIGTRAQKDTSWKGRIDEVRVYDRALSGDEIRRRYFYGRTGLFQGDYNTSLNLDDVKRPVKLEVNSTGTNSSENRTWFYIDSSEEGSQTVSIDPGEVNKNYSLDFSQPGGSLDLEINLTASQPTKTPVINSFRVWAERFYPRIKIQSPFNTTVTDATPWLNVTSPDDVDTWKYSVDGGSNNSFTPNITLPSLADGFHSLRVWANETEGGWNSTTRYFTVNTVPPLWRNQGQDSDTISATASIELRAQGYDSFNLTESYLATNETGSWKNRTGFYGSPRTLNTQNTWTWSNFTWQNNSIKDERIAWKIWYRGSEGEYNSTDEKSFYVEATDTVKPVIRIQSPLNSTINDATPWLNVTADEEISIWSYNLDAQGNQTFEPNITIGPLTDGFHNVTVWGNDTADNWASDRVYFYVDTVKPRWRSLKDNSSGSIVQGKVVNISAQARDIDTGIYRALLSTNESGSWKNYTAEYGSPDVFSNTTDWEIADFTWKTDSFFGRLGYRVWSRDAAGNWNRTDAASFSVSEQIEVKTAQLKEIEKWKGDFNATSVTREDNSGDLGIGYRNGSEGDSLMGFWRLDRVSGSAKDYSGNGFDGTNYGSIRGANGVFSTSSYSFGGSSDYVDVADTDKLDLVGGSLTVSAWIKTSSSERGGIVRKNNLSSWNPVYELEVNNNGNGKIRFLIQDNSGGVDFLSSQSVNDGKWHLVTGTYDESTEEARIYIDGSLDSSTTATIADADTSGALQIGRMAQASTSTTNSDTAYFDGKIDEVRIYNRSLSQDQINQLYFYGKDSVFNGDYNRTVAVPSSGRLTRMNVDYENAATTGNRSWIRIDTTNGETQEVRLSGTKVKNYTLNFTQDGGKAFVHINFTASTPKKTPVINSLDLFSRSLSYSFNTTLRDSTGSVYPGATLRFRDQFGNIVSSADTTTENYLEDGLARGVNYTLENAAPIYSSFFKAEIRDLRLDRNRKIEPQIVENYTGSIPSELEDIKTVYAFNDSYLDYGHAKLTFPKLGIDTNSVVHCLDWDYSTATCNNWEVKPASSYGAKQNDTHIWFTVENFDAFGVGEAKTLPNVTSIAIYDVTDLAPAEKEVGGKLVQQGLNTTFDLGHQAGRQYRFQFRVENAGDGDWSLLGEDKLYHDGLNTTWAVPKIWYNISWDYDGGTFANGKVTWNTSKGGVLSPNGTNSTMYAKYLVNITENKSRLYNQRFYVNDTSESTGSEDFHVLNITKYGFLDVSLTEPPSSLTVCKNEVFTVNTTVNCRGGKCGDVSTSARYNSSGTGADTLIPENSGTPFHVDGANTGLCGTLGRGEQCFTSWDVNASGSLGPYSIDSNASSSLDRFTGNDSSDASVNIETALYSTFFPGEVDFGVLDPGQLDNPAPGNTNHKYNLSVEGCVNNADTWIKGSELDTGGYGNYSIHENNVSYALENDISNETSLTTNYTGLKTSVPSGTNVTTFYWIDIPEGIKAADYTGKLYFKVNTTE